MLRDHEIERRSGAREMARCPRLVALCYLTIWGTLAPSLGAQNLHQSHQTENVLLVTFDGLRWQELFGGADEALISDETGNVGDPESLRERFWRDTAEQRRQALLPFFWSEIATQGQVFGDPKSDSVVRVTNGKNFSYPGYNEILAGKADDRIFSNNKAPNPNLTVLEWLHQKEGFEGRVAAFASWDVFPYILAQERSGIYVNAGWEALDPSENEARDAAFEQMRRELPRVWDTVRYDVFTYEGAARYLQTRRPRVLYVAFGETDDWAHGGEYDHYLDSAHRTDDYLRRLWQVIQGNPEYQGKTSLVVTTDHGRGNGPDDWSGHGADTGGSERIWIAVLGPDTPPSGLRRSVEVRQSQVAATVAALLGRDFLEASPEAAEPLPGIFFDR